MGKISNYLKTAFRNVWLNKFHSLVSVSGLVIGIASAILILIYIKFEFSFDDFHTDAGRLYRVSVKNIREGNFNGESAQFVPPLAEAMYNEFPEVENFCRLSSPKTLYLFNGDKSVKINMIQYADSSFFELFSFPLIEGDRSSVLTDPYSIVLTENASQLLFGKEKALGKTIRVDKSFGFKITGIVKDPPENSQLQFNVLISFATLYKDPNNYMDWNGGNQYYSYIKLKPGTEPRAVDEKFLPFMWGHINKDLSSIGVKYVPYLQAFNDVHLYYNEGDASIFDNIKVFALIGAGILLIACINFINLFTARSGKRYKEIGVKKVLGASKKDLIVQFLIESFLISIISTLLALFLVELILPLFNDLTGVSISLKNSIDTQTILGVLGILLLTGITAGIYPAFYLASFKPVRIFKGNYYRGKTGFRIRNGLVIFQFAVSIALIISTLIIYKQINFVKGKQLGFNKENMLVIPLIPDDAKNKSDLLKTEISKIAGVENCARSSAIPMDGFTSNGYFPEGFSTPLLINVIDVDEDFLNTYGISVTNGRNFSEEIITDNEAYLVNICLEDKLGWNDTIGKEIKRNGNHKVIGVVNNFHFSSLYNLIQPLIITNKPWNNKFDFITVKARGSNIEDLINDISLIWEKVVPSIPMEYYFLDEQFNLLYKAEEKYNQIFLGFSILTILIALLGLFSLSAFTAEQRTKEIGIRKVLGASTLNISKMLYSEFLILIIIANVIAWPAAYLFVQSWLADFAYKISPDLLTFLTASFIALIIALIAVSYHAVRVSNSNPVNSLKYE